MLTLCTIVADADVTHVVAVDCCYSCYCRSCFFIAVVVVAVVDAVVADLPSPLALLSPRSS